jgi:hypothetical protein
MKATAEKYIRYYNRLNGKPVSIATLKEFHSQVASAIAKPEVNGYKADLQSIYKRLTDGIAKAGKEPIIRIHLVPIDPERKTGHCVRVAAQGNKPKVRTITREVVKVKEVRPKNLIAEEVDITKIHTDTKRFQNRQDAFSEASAQSVAENYDPNKFDPIVVWQDPKLKKIFVLSGHSRYEGMKRRKAKTISVRYFKGSEVEAIRFAKVEANRAATQETLIEDLAAYKLMRDGDEKRNIKKLNKTELQKIFKGKVQKLDAYSHLNPRGLFVNALSQATTSNYPYLERNAQWIGQLRKEHPVISTTGEDNIFHFFYSDKTGKHLKLTKDEFFKTAKRKIHQLGKGEGVLFPECGTDGCKSFVDKELDPSKGDAYKRLREIGDTLSSIEEKLKSKDPKVRVSTQGERDYLVKELGPRLVSEKEKILRDLNLMDRSQANLFGYHHHDKQKKSLGKMKLNKLQKAQLQDSIKAGSTPKINKRVKKGSEKKGWTDTPLFKQELESRQTSMFGLGFITADKRPQKMGDTFTLPGVIGSILGNLQRYKLEIVIAGETHSGKSELGKQIADAFISIGDEVCWIDWEQGGLRSDHTYESIERNVKPENRKKLHVSSDVPKNLEAVKALGKKFRVVVIDSGSSLKLVTNSWIDELREEYPETVWIPLMQQNEKGGTKGGTSAEFDSPVVIKTYRPDENDYTKNYAYVFKNRGNKTGQYYLIASKKIGVLKQNPK